jgi:hypothetical protein
MHSTPRPHDIHFRASLRGVSYRLAVEVSSDCPPDASVFECSDGAGECSDVPCDVYWEECAAVVEEGASIVYDPSAFKCTLVRSDILKSDSKNLQITLAFALVGLILLAVTGLALLWFKVLYLGGSDSQKVLNCDLSVYSLICPHTLSSSCRIVLVTAAGDSSATRGWSTWAGRDGDTRHDRYTWQHNALGYFPS